MPLAEIDSDHLDDSRRGYPRPQLRRHSWYSLNGEWEFSIDTRAGWSLPAQVEWTHGIRVPFAPETQASGVGHTSFFSRCWYRRRVTLDQPTADRLILRFCAVDYNATVWVNDLKVGAHEGGYTPFAFDITSLIAPDGTCEIVVCADDDPHDLAKPRGKQDWQLEPHSIWYPRTSGIWQTVWIERLPPTALKSVSFTPNLERWEIGVAACVEGSEREDCRLAITLTSRGKLLASDTYSVVAGEVHRRIALSDPGIDDSRNEVLWSPDSPNLIDVRLDLTDERGALLDHARSYTALRAVAVQGDRVVLNNRPYLLRMVLDQGYWPDCGMTAPDDAALQRDVRLAKAMGFNGVRKHQKIEEPRYLYWADHIGLVIWEEMPSAYRFTRESVDRLTHEWKAVIARDYSHPCIIAWVPINESWGVPNLPDNRMERHYVQALYHLTHTLDATRPVIGNDGWESVATDIIGIHDYDHSPERIARRYHAEELLPRLFKRERPGGRLLVLEGHHHADQPLMITEFGGIAFANRSGSWGYSRAETSADLAKQYRRLLDVVKNLAVLSGFCYTQFADTYQEGNGLLYADRTPKFPMEEIVAATRGGSTVRTDGLEQLTPVDDA